MGPTEDVPYTNIDDFATPEKENKKDPDQPNKSVLIEVSEDLGEAIEAHSGFDVIDLTEASKMNPTQQIAVHKLVVSHLKSAKLNIDNKIKELK